MYDELKRLGVVFVSKNEQFDTSSAIGEAMLKIILVFAELERNMTAERVTAVMLSRANNGQWNGGRVPYGYAYDKQTKEFSLDPAESQVVRRMYELYEREQSLVTVCRYFNAKGIYSRSGNEWTPTTVNKILKNQFYVGKYRYNVTKQEWKKWSKRDESEWITIDNHHVPLIDDVLFDRIQFILQRNRRGIVDDRSSYIKKNIHIFAGLVKCGSCGSNMSATLDRVRADGWRPSVYGCSKRRNYYCMNECPIGCNKPVSCENLEIDRVTVKLLKSLQVGRLEEIKGKLLDIAEDGVITEDEKPELKEVMDYLDHLAVVLSENDTWHNAIAMCLERERAMSKVETKYFCRPY